MDTKSFHLENTPAPEGILKGVASKGEFHENACNDAETTQAASETLLAEGTRNDAETTQAASEALLEGGDPKRCRDCPSFRTGYGGSHQAEGYFSEPR